MYRVPFTLAYYGGMRLSEIERLTWKHHQCRQERLYFAGAKTGEWRYVPLLGGTVKLLASLPRGRDNDLMFPGFDDRSARAHAWRKAAAAVGLGAWHCRKCDAEVFDRECPEHGHLVVKDIKYHGPLFRFTRTTAIRTLTNRGVPTARVMQMMGHKTFSVHMGYNVEEEADLDLIREKYDCNQNVTR